MTKPHVLIIGAGVAGLVTHIALRRAGISSVIYERASQARLSGGPLWLWTNAVRALDGLGLGGALRDVGTFLEHNEVRTWQGDTLYTIPVGDMSRRHGAPSIIIPRQALLEILLAAIEPGCLHLDFDVERWDCASPGQVELFERQGRSEKGTVLVGADGIRSVVRAALLDDGPPRSAEQVARVGLARLEHPLLPPGIAMATLGVGKRFWAVALNGGTVGWYGILSKQLDQKLGLAEAFADAHEPILEIVQNSDPANIAKTELFDRPPTRGWFKDNVVLVGDAIHPATPDLGQGACQAIESAVCLAAKLKRARSDVHALRSALFEYEAERAVRSAFVSRLAKMTSVVSSREESWLARPRELAVAWSLPWTTHLAFDYILSSQTGDPGYP